MVEVVIVVMVNLPNDSSSPLPFVVLAGFEPVWTKSGEMSVEMSLTPTTIEKFSKNEKK